MNQIPDASRPENDPPARPPEWALFHANQTIWDAALSLCEGARRSIDVEQYIFAPGGIGGRLLDVMAARARQGVAVRILADGFGSRGLAESEAGQKLIRSGGRILSHGGLDKLLRHPRSALHRLHRKTVICDGDSLMLGGSCFDEAMADWRDTMIRLDGPLPPAVAAEYDRAWRAAGGTGSAAEPPCPGTESGSWGTDGWAFAASGPGTLARPNLRRLLLQRIATARSEVFLTTPYLVPGRALWRAITTARAGGARVTILMPARSDHRPVDIAGRIFAHALKRRGVAIRLYIPGMLHAKLAQVDDWCCVGSFNMDVLSAKLNLENAVVSRAAPLRDALSAQREVDLAASEPL